MEKEIKARSRLQKTRKIIGRSLLFLFLFVVGIVVVLSVPAVQTRIAHYVTQSLNRDFKTDISIDKVAVSLFGGVKFREVLILDHHKDTLLYARRIQTNILSFRQLYNGDLHFGDVSLDGTVFNLRNYKKETETNLDVFIRKFDTGTKSSGRKFLLEARNVYFTDSRFMLINDNHQSPKDVYFSKLSASLNNFRIYGPEISAKINKLAFVDYRGLEVKHLSARFSYTKEHILLDDLSARTQYSEIDGYVHLLYKRTDFIDFNNKVRFDAQFDSARIGSNDIRYFYDELGKDLVFKLKTKAKGTLNKLKFQDALLTQGNTAIRGDLLFVNLLGGKNKPFLLDGRFSQLSANYEDLVALLPKVLGTALPRNLKTLGQANLKGNALITAKNLDARFFLTSAIGNIRSELQMKNMADKENVRYSADVEMENFNIGRFLEQSDLGPASMNVKIDGSGFTQKSLQTSVKGTISRLYFNKYSYRNIVVDGDLRSPAFKGKLIVNDPNLLMDFDGLIDISQREWRYDLHANIDFAYLSKLKFAKDTISVFKGDIRANIAGNTLDGMRGTVSINETVYQNQKDTYLFDDFTLTSSFDPQGVKTMTIRSPDIIDGKVVGKFRFADLGKIAQNAVGSLYTNYKPDRVPRGQYLKFDFSIYNKVVEVFFPGIEVANNTFIRGSMDADEKEFRLNFSSPNIKAFGNDFENIGIKVDNKNPLYNAYVQMDSIKTKLYKISDFNLINVTMKDTMYLRSEFKGGKTGNDNFRLNLYHTIDKQNHNIVGIQRSELKFKEFLWLLNEQNADNNKIIFDKKFQNFTFDDIALTHENQKVELMGKMRDSTYKDLSLSFENVELDKILPPVDSLKVNGKLDGKISFSQEKSIYRPTAALDISALGINGIALGKLNLNIQGDDAFRRFRVNSALENDNVKSFQADGFLVVGGRDTQMDLDLNFDRFNLAAFSPLGKNIIANIRGLVSGTCKVTGPVGNPDLYGRLFLEKAGFKVPYLNTDYAIGEHSVIDLEDNKFTFRNSTLKDTKHNTEGKLNGSIKHKNFQDWTLDLAVSSNRFLALDTKDSEDAAYYGTAYIDGKASIKGPTDALFIEVAAQSAAGTELKIPINNSESTGNKAFMHFLTPQEKINIQKGMAYRIKDYNGLELKFELDITPQASIEVILDRETGHGMKATGNGTLLLEINTLGKFNMYGDYQVYKGEYNFRYKGLFDKRFEVKKYSSISWEGDPMRARLNLEATYTTAANPSVLLDNPTVNRKVDVNVGIIITGNLSNPEPDFSINFPKMNTVLKSEIQSKLEDRDIRQTQALTLLSTGGFLSNEGVNQTAITNNLVETAGGIFDNIFQKQDDKIKIGLLLETAEKNPNYESTGSVGFTVSSQINDRITVNGKLGVPVGGVNESAIVGDVEIQYRVNEDGTMNLRFFNRENDINYLGEGIGYTQGVGVTYEVDFDTFNELVSKIFGSTSVEKNKKPVEQAPEETALPPYMNFPDKKKKTQDTSTPATPTTK